MVKDMSEEEIKNKIKLLEDNIYTKKWVMNHPSYPPTYQEKCIAEDRIEEIQKQIEELNKLLN